MNDEVFARLVAEDVKNKSSESQKKYLMMPENILRWKRALKYLSDNLEEQMTEIDIQEKERVSRFINLGEEGSVLLAESSSNSLIRRSKIERFRFFVNHKLDEVTRISSTTTQDENSAEDFYRRAIKKWWELMENFEMEPTRVDLALYASLDGKWGFDDLNKDNNFPDFSE